jgi:hypothetical protein
VDIASPDIGIPSRQPNVDVTADTVRRASRWKFPSADVQPRGDDPVSIPLLPANRLVATDAHFSLEGQRIGCMRRDGSPHILVGF